VPKADGWGDGGSWYERSDALIDRRTWERPPEAARIRGDYAAFLTEDGLTGQERLAFGMLAEGYRPREIAVALEVTRPRVSYIKRASGQKLVRFFGDAWDFESPDGQESGPGAKVERCGLPIHVYLPYVAETQDEKMYQVVMDRERWFSVVMGEKYKVDARSTDRMAERIPLPESAASALAFRLEVALTRAGGAT